DFGRINGRANRGETGGRILLHGYVLSADRSCRDGIAKRQRRRNGGNGFLALADTHDRDVAVVHNAADDALIDVDALDLVETHLEGPPLDEPGLVDDPHVGDVGLSSPT